jgi:hypothetical protein
MSALKSKKQFVLLPLIVALLIGVFALFQPANKESTADLLQAAAQDQGEVSVSVVAPQFATSEAAVDVHPVDCAHCISVETPISSSALSVPALARIDAIFAGFQNSASKPLAADSVDFVQGAVVGESVEMSFADVDLVGVVDSVKHEQSISHVGVRLEEDLGRAVFSHKTDGGLLAYVFFNGDSRVLQLSGDEADSWSVMPTIVSAVYCAPSGSVYPVSSNAGNVAENAEPRLAPVGAAAGFVQIALSSLPGAEYVIYLDFDGESVTHPWWNNGGTIDASPHAQVNNDSWVIAVWERASEDFSPFKINVTTDRAQYVSADSSKRVMCVVTPTKTAAPSAGGVAYRNTFGESVPCWAFNASEYDCAETISHEVGHTLGLVHDGKEGGDDEYFGGHGSGETGWGPIMGATFQGSEESNVTQWSIGEYTGAVNYFTDEATPNTQDDLDVIAANGFGYRVDDAGDSIAMANGLNSDGAFIDQAGIISTSVDVDYYTFYTLDGDVLIVVDGLDVESEETPNTDTLGGNLAVEITLYDEFGTVIDTQNPTDELGATIAETLVEGTYYVSVAGASRGAPATDGFSTYASLGQYFISGYLPTGPLSVFGGDSQDQLIINGDQTPSIQDGTAFGLVSITNPDGLEQTFSFNNTGNEVITVTELSFESGEFSADMASPFEVTPQGSTSVVVSYLPSDIGITGDVMSFSYYEASDPGTLFSYSFTVQGVASKTDDDDNYEENDSYFEAFFFPEQIQLINVLGAGRQADNDWYRISVVPGFNEVEVVCDFDGAVGDVNIALYDGRGYLLTTSEGSSDQETIRYVVDAAGGAQYIRVYGDNTGTEYDLTWQGLSPLIFSPGGDDNYEDNYLSRDATNLKNHKDQWLSAKDGDGVQKNNDWYEIKVNANEQITVTLNNTGAFGGSIQCELRASNAVYIRATSLAGQIVYQGNSETIYYIRVFGDNLGQSYDLLYEDDPVVVTPDGAGEDNYEQNDSFFKPYNLTADQGTLLADIDGVGAQYDQDWYLIQSADGENVIRCEFALDADVSGLEFAIYDHRGYRVSEALSPVDGGLLTIRTGLESEAAYVVALGENSGQTYDFTWTSFYSAPGEDLYEVNNTLLTAYPLLGQENVSLSALAGLGAQFDADWYQIDTQPGDVGLRIEAIFTNSEGNINISLYDEDENEIAFSNGNTDGEIIVSEVPSEGIYYVLVSGANAGNEYDLKWVSLADLNDDAYEENDSIEGAYLLPSTETGKLSDLDGLGIKLDEDFYEIDIPKGATSLSVSLWFSHEDGDIDLRAYDSNFDQLASSPSVTNNEFIRVSVGGTATQTIYLEVGFATNPSYDLEWEFRISNFADADFDLLSDSWERKYASAIVDFSSDFNGDGDRFPAWFEYAMNTDPTVADSVQSEVFEDGGYMHVRFSRSKAAVSAGYQYIVKESSSLEFADDLADYISSVDKGEYEEVTYRCSRPIVEAGQCFFVVTVEQPEL